MRNKNLRIRESLAIIKEDEETYQFIFTSTRKVKRFRVNSLVKSIIDLSMTENTSDSIKGELSRDYSVMEIYLAIDSLEKSGILRSVERDFNERVRKAIDFTDEPKFPQWFCEPVKERQQILEEQYGSSLALDEETAKVKSIAEAIERYCSETLNENTMVIDSYFKLKNAVDPRRFVNFSANQLGSAKEEYLDKICETKMDWVWGKDLKNNQQVLIPAQFVHSPYDLTGQPIIRIPISTGAAFSTDKKTAIRRGLLEIIERDAFMLTWLTKKECLRMDVGSDMDLGVIEKYFNRYSLECYALDITTDVGVPSVMGILIDRTGIGPAVSVGLKSDFSVKEATQGALLEAQHVRGWIRFSHLRDNGPAVKTKYQIKDLKSRGYFWYPRSKIKDLDFLLKGGGVSNQLNFEGENGDLLVSRLLNRGFDIYTVDLTTPEVRENNFCVIKSISPQFHPLSLDENFPYDYSARLNKLKVYEVNEEPHPFL